MLSIKGLKGINSKKINKVTDCLNSLISFKDENGYPKPIITGYNWFDNLIKLDRIVTFSHIHESEDYKVEMMRDLVKLGYSQKKLLNCFRKKEGIFIWDPDFIIRENGEILPGLRIFDLRTREDIELKEYLFPLVDYPKFQNGYGQLVAEDKGWEFNHKFKSKKELLALIKLFLQKSGFHIYDINNRIILESTEEINKRNPWSGAYKTPVLLLGENALKFQEELPDFVPATKIALKEKNNEISFVIQAKLDLLRDTTQYQDLINYGFGEEVCLANKPFIKAYINK